MKLQSIRLENIGGFTTTEFSLRDDVLLIGENNSGKTSLLRVIDWILNGLDDQLLEGGRDLTASERQLLLPARDTRNRARRIFLRVRNIDGRSQKKFGAKGGLAEARIQFRAGNNFARLGSPSRGEEATSESNAVDLIRRVRASYSSLYIPATRDGRSQLFEDSLRTVLRDRLDAGMLYDGVGRPAGVPKRVQDASTALKDEANKLALTVWDEAKKMLQGGFSPAGDISASLTPADLVELVMGKLVARFSTGAHDSNTVGVEYLGAGLQSALAMAVAQLSIAGRRNQLLLVEEPEAFLHPSSQRTIAQQILSQPHAQTIAATHSSSILAEAAPSSVVVLRGHSTFPAIAVSPLQEAKDRYFLSTVVSQAMFDRSLLLVEGPGEVAFYEALRRRLQKIVGQEVVNRMRVCSVGGKESFGPWLRLLRRYQNANSTELAFNALVCADSIDAGADVLRALRDSGVVVPATASSPMTSLFVAADKKNPTAAEIAAVSTKTAKLNTIAMQSDIPFHFNCVDLEYAMLEGVSEPRIVQFATANSFKSTTRDALMAEMGSKGGAGQASKKQGAKAAYVRSILGEWIEWGELTATTKDLLWRWILGTFEPTSPIPKRPAELT